MTGKLHGKVALITGSTQGIGRAIAQTLRAEGCKVMLNGRDRSKIKDSDIIEGEQDFFSADVTQISECQALIQATIKKFGKLDILVCNVGSGKSVQPGLETAEEWNKLLDLNLISTVQTIDAARSELSRTRGSIVCISSICGLETLNAPVAYSVAKAGLNAYIQGIARPLFKEGIRVNGVAPGNIVFQGSTWEKKLKTDPTAVTAMLEREVTVGRLGKPEEIADLVAFLVSPRASFICATIAVIDGGQVRS